MINRVGALAGIAFLSAGVAWASGSSVWVTDSAEDFAKGEAQGLVVTSRGSLFLGAQAQRVSAEDESLWALARTEDGIFAGSAPGGKLLRVAGAKLETVYDSPELMITALLANTKGDLFAASMPDGRIFKRAKDGTISDVAVLQDGHVWCLALSADEQTLYAGTGPKGRLYAVDLKTGKAAELWKGEDDNVLSLALSDTGALYFGVSAKGRVYRHEKDRARLLAELPEAEVRALAFVGGRLFAAANSAKKGLPRTYTVQSAPSGRTAPPHDAGEPQEKPGEFTGLVAQVGDDGQVTPLLRLEENFFTALAPASGGGVFAATGKGGKVYEVADVFQHQVVLDLEDDQALSLLVDGGALVGVGAGEKGAFTRLQGAADAGVFTSAVHDAEFPSNWGRLTIDATYLPQGEGPALSVLTRSGNTEKPDETWSLWSEVAQAPPSELADLPTQAPPGRYFQFQLSIAPRREVEVRQVSVYYLPHNQAPKLTEWKLEGFTWLSRRLGAESHATEKKLSWKVEDPDKDTLVTRLWYRLTGREDWTLLTKPEPLEKPEFAWQTETVPDGVYELKIEVSDERSNSADRTRRTVRVSDPFLIDNRAPRFWLLRADETGVIEGEAIDTQSPITAVEVSLDGGAFVLIDPDDLIYDQRREKFRWQAEVAPGRHVAALRARDADGNVTVEKLEFTKK